MRSSSKRESLFNGLVLSVMLLSNVPVALRHPALLGEEQFLLLSSQLREGRRFAFIGVRGKLVSYALPPSGYSLYLRGRVKLVIPICLMSNGLQTPPLR